MKTLTFNVQGMTCVVCSGTVEKALKALPTAEGVAVNFASGKAVISYDENVISETDIAMAVTKAGYKPVIGEVKQEKKHDLAQIKLIVSFVLGMALLLWAMLPMIGVPYPDAISPDNGTLAFATVQLILCVPVPILNFGYYIRFITMCAYVWARKGWGIPSTLNRFPSSSRSSPWASIWSTAPCRGRATP